MGFVPLIFGHTILKRKDLLKEENSYNKSVCENEDFFLPMKISKEKKKEIQERLRAQRLGQAKTREEAVRRMKAMTPQQKKKAEKILAGIMENEKLRKKTEWAAKQFAKSAARKEGEKLRTKDIEVTDENFQEAKKVFKQ